MPDAPTRAKFNAFIKNHDADFALNVFVIEAPGLAENVFRGVITTLAAIGSKRSSLRVMSNVLDVVKWPPAAHRRATGVDIDPAALARALETTRGLCS